ncbi:MAG: Holliday junction resolvase RuvX [Flavobacteriales bacterium]|nr:Holliday junction resolvase RuvX [Flavobacteriales bacterium]MCX7650739.1 Holliday junction resolvase RuvX [Flavobacteriales bacterium]MDW8432659.1 Holliday junction resolvase RuvX [Flavobacteriales bacterium]
MGFVGLIEVQKGSPAKRGRYLALDYGVRRCGLAVSDPLGIIAGPLQAVSTQELKDFLKDYLTRENVQGLVVGYALHKDGAEVEHERDLLKFIEWLKAQFPHVGIYRLDEKYTSRMAERSLLQAGARRKDRRAKENVDVVSAILMLQEFLNYYKEK